ncbi:MAG: hypothetical protein JSW61_14565 [Candidatus Thorarchaeota archaeon]|nr:MAG: hypothetical protein JSW61_14565 [Candidatus Thorarchaeota archaeon]
MGCKAEGAAQGYTVLGGIVLGILAIRDLIDGIDRLPTDSANATVDILLAVALIIMVILSFDASGYIHWKVQRNGLILALFGFFSIIIVARRVVFDPIAWLMSLGTLAGFMILLAGLLLVVRG